MDPMSNIHKAPHATQIHSIHSKQLRTSPPTRTGSPARRRHDAQELDQVDEKMQILEASGVDAGRNPRAVVTFLRPCRRTAVHRARGLSPRGAWFILPRELQVAFWRPAQCTFPIMTIRTAQMHGRMGISSVVEPEMDVACRGLRRRCFSSRCAPTPLARGRSRQRAT